MKPFYIALAATILWALWVIPSHAQMSCTNNTVFLPDGRVVIVTTCCTPNGYCTTTMSQ